MTFGEKYRDAYPVLETHGFLDGSLGQDWERAEIDGPERLLLDAMLEYARTVPSALASEFAKYQTKETERAEYERTREWLNRYLCGLEAEPGRAGLPDKDVRDRIYHACVRYAMAIRPKI